ncbi:TSC22 domain family protein 2 [Liparis tanakae]|uniref:TSC22 domain family protein 2 n=1 Tax=Liparis tanakae TaxID=230148 RepID=A0A4Z2GM07_9TELE|nr:TSC22 domain family protein 2 [Liparis tanakae]
MSKMPAKKKSCFQITSVTQAQVAAICGADDTESLEDPDESRAEDVSSEIYDTSRPEYEPACGRSSPEEALNNVGEPEAVSVPAPAHIPQAGPVSALSGHLAGEFRKVGARCSAPGPQPARPGAMQQQQPAPAAAPAGVSVNAPQPAATPPATSTVSCTSRFRVIKLDHGTGEPFRRGRWTCTEFYEKDSEGSAGTRTVEGIRHAGATTLDPAADRDSGIGHTGGSVVAPATHSGQGLSSVADAALPLSRMHSVEMPPQQQQPQIHHQNYGGSAPHAVLPVGQNGLPQPAVQIQKPPIMPPSAQPTAYLPQQQQQHSLGHHLNSQASVLLQNHTEYYQQQQPGLSTGQSLPVSSLSAGPHPVGQGHPSVLHLASGGASVPSLVGDVAGTGGVSVPAGQPAPGLLQQLTGGMGPAGGSIMVGGSALSPYTAAGQPQPHGLHPASSGVQNVPATAGSSSVPTTVPSASSAAMPNMTTSSLPPGQISHSRTLVALGMQCLPATGFGHEGGGGKSEGLVNAHSPVVSGKEPMKPFMPESLQLATPTVNSLFGIHIPVDGDVDSVLSEADCLKAPVKQHGASGTNVAAIDNKIEQAMDLVKSHLMYAVREEVEVLKEQIKELYERNSMLEKENAVLKSLANSEQLSQLPAQPATSAGTTPPQQGLGQPQQQPPLQLQPQPPLQLQPQPQPHPQLQLQTPPQLDPSQQQMQPNVTSA